MFIYVLPFLLSLTLAEPEPEPMIPVGDNINDVFLEIMEYEDDIPPFFPFDMMGAMPLLTVVDIQRKLKDPASDKQYDDAEDIAYFEQIAEVKSTLDEVLSQLHVARNKLTDGNQHIFPHIEKSIQGLKKMERKLNPNVHQFSTSARKSMSIKMDSGKPVIQTSGEMSMSTKMPLDPDTPEPEVQREEKVFKTPSGEETLVTETKKYDDGQNAAFHKKWTWKSNTLV